MKTQRLEALPAAAPLRSAARAPAGILAQRHSTLGGGSATAPPILGPGHPLEPATRHEMERGFGRDFGAIRVHDDARAHDNARSLGAIAYAAGNDIAFGQGHYAPQTAAGRALIAHELAHSVQQGGVQMKADGSLPVAADARLEAEADRAAAAVVAGRPAPSLSRIGAPAVFRANTQPAITAVANPVPTAELPAGAQVDNEEPEAGTGATLLHLTLPQLDLPREKGSGPWVQDAYTAVANADALVFIPKLGGKKIKAIMEKPGTDYQLRWLNRHGFTKLSQVAEAFETSTDPDVKSALGAAGVSDILAGFKKGLQGGCDIDHIVEKQLGGGSVGTNLQLLLSDKNQKAGTATYNLLVTHAEAILQARPNLVDLRIRYKSATAAEDKSFDASYQIESLLQAKKVAGSATVSAAALGAPVALVGGGMREVVPIAATGKTPIGSAATRLVSGLKLNEYHRKGARKDQKDDEIKAELSSKPMIPGDELVTLQATLCEDPAGTAMVGAGGSPVATAKEARALTVLMHKNGKIPFRIPYMSKGELTELKYGANGKLTGKGTITPTVSFLGKLDIVFGPDMLKVVKGLEPEKLKSPAPSIFRFTKGDLSLELAPQFLPTGSLDFTIGPKTDPLINGNISAVYKDGAFAAVGKLTQARKIPGIAKAAGTVEYHSQKGWSGLLTGESASILGSTVTAALGFRPGKDGLEAYGTGGLKTTIRGSPLELNCNWDGTTVSYSGWVEIEDPMPLVKKVRLEGSYKGNELTLSGAAPISWGGIDANMQVTYRQKDDEKGKFSGSADILFPKDKKVGGALALQFDEEGNFAGKGTISYQLTPNVRPTLTAEYKQGKLKMFGEVKIGDIPLTKEWPQPGGAKKPIIKGVGVKFSVPTPVLLVTAYGEIKGSLGVGYGVGPVMLKGVTFNGELYPLEKDPKPVAKLTGKFSLPAYGELYGTFGAYIGAEIAFGLAGAKGGIEVTPSLRISGEAGVDFNAAYAAGGFSFSAHAAITAALTAKLKVDFAAEIYAFRGWASSKWTYPLAAVSKQIGPQFKMTLGQIAYAPDGTITWPSLSQVKFEPESIDPMQLVQDLMKEGKES